MDMRTFGKGFQRYRDMAEQEHGVRFVRNRVHSVEIPETEGDLRVVYSDISGVRHEEDFDLVVLAAGQRPPSMTKDLAEITGVDLNPWGFCQTEGFSLSRTKQDGVLIGGSFSGLRDISESVIQASSASLSASQLIHSKGGGLAEEPGAKTEFRDVSKEIPKVSVVLCACGGTLREAADLDSLAEWLKTRGSISQVHTIDSVCTQEGWDELRGTVQESDANRVLIAGCMPYVYSKKLEELGKSAGLDPALMDVVDIRTPAFPGRDTEKEVVKQDIRRVISMGIARIKGMDPAPVPSTKIVTKALVVGAGIAGMTAALGIADHGYEVSLVERAKGLGGNLCLIHRTIKGDSPQDLLE